MVVIRHLVLVSLIFWRGLYERLMNAIKPDVLVDLEKLLTGQNRLYES